MEWTPELQSEVLDLTRRYLREAAGGDAPARAEGLSPALLSPAGCFVSLHSRAGNHLRGCVGRVDATRPLKEALRAAAVAVLDDPRFSTHPVRLEELPELEVEVSVLSPMRPAASPLEFDPREDGIYLTCRGRSGLFLPQVGRETGWTREQLLDRLCSEKMDLPGDCWREAGAQLQTFSVQIIGPAPFST